jgi:TPR repeat protein
MFFFNSKIRVTLIGLILGLLMGGCAEESEFERTSRLANDGNALAQLNLGLMYRNGEGVPQDNKLAVKWYTMSAEQGHAKAQYNLGLMYASEKGVSHDDKEAVRWYRLSAEQGYADAQYNLGVMYYNGEGVPQDYKEAHAWWSVAKANGQELAEKILGIVTKKMTNEQIVQAKSISIEISKRIEANRKD